MLKIYNFKVYFKFKNIIKNTNKRKFLQIMIQYKTLNINKILIY